MNSQVTEEAFNMKQKIRHFIDDERGSAGGYIACAVGVMVVVLLLAFVTVIISTYIRFEAIQTEVEQKMNNSAAVIASVYEDDISSYKRLAEADENGYVGIPSAEIYDTFYEDFSKSFSYEGKDYTIENPAITLGCSASDGFGITYGFSAKLTVRVILFNKSIGEISKDINIGASHNNMFNVDEVTEDGDIITVPAGVDGIRTTDRQNETVVDNENLDETELFGF